MLLDIILGTLAGLALLAVSMLIAMIITLLFGNY